MSSDRYYYFSEDGPFECLMCKKCSIKINFRPPLNGSAFRKRNAEIKCAICPVSSLVPVPYNDETKIEIYKKWMEGPIVSQWKFKGSCTFTCFTGFTQEELPY